MAVAQRPVLLITAVFSGYDAALDWAKQTLEAAWGPIPLESARFEHRETTYYEATMGPDLKKVFFAFEQLVDRCIGVEKRRDDHQSCEVPRNPLAEVHAG